MATSYPDRTNARGIWRLSDITRNIKTEGTFPSSTRILFGGGATPSVVNNIDIITVESTGDATDFGDLASLNYQGGGGNASSFSRGIFGIGKTPSGTDAIEYVQFSTTGNAADFGDKTNSVTGFAGASNKIRAVFAGGYSRTNVMDYITIATTGDAIDFGDLTVARGGTGAVSNGTRIFVGAGNNPSDNSVNVIDEHFIAATGNAVDFGDLVQATQNPYSGSNSTRAIFAGGLQQSSGSGPQLSSADIFEMNSRGNAVNFGNLSAAMYSNYGSSSPTRAVAGGGSDPSNAINVIEYFTFASAGNAVDFGDLTAARQDTTPAGNGHGGLQTFDPRPPELYSPTGKVVPRGLSVGDIMLILGGELSSDTANIDFLNISTLGNSSNFGNLSSARLGGGGIGGITRAITMGGGNANTSDYVEFSTKGNAADFGDLSVARTPHQGNHNNNTRGIAYAGAIAGSPYASNVIDYITIATFGNATDFGDAGTVNYGWGGTGSSTRMVAGGSITSPGQADTNVIEYVEIASTGDGADFGDLTATLGKRGAVNSSTRSVFGGGVNQPAKTNIMDYVTTASTGNATDFGDLTVARDFPAGSSNNTRGVFAGGRNPGSNNTIDYITIASTGNATDFGDTSSVGAVAMAGGASNGHGGLS